MLNRALSKAKREGGKKVPINFQVPGELKEQFEELCKKNEVSITSMLTGLMETAIEEAQGIYYEVDASSLLALHNRMKEVNDKLEAFYQHYGFPFDLFQQEQSFNQKIDTSQGKYNINTQHYFPGSPVGDIGIL